MFILSDVSDSLQPCGQQPARLLCLWDSPGKNTGMPPPGHLLHPGMEPTSPGFAALQADSLPTERQGSAWVSRNPYEILQRASLIFLATLLSQFLRLNSLFVEVQWIPNDLFQKSILFRQICSVQTNLFCLDFHLLVSFAMSELILSSLTSRKQMTEVSEKKSLVG